MSCRAIKIELYIDVSSPSSYLQVERVTRMYEACSYRHNLELRYTLLSPQANNDDEQQQEEKAYCTAVSQEMGITLTHNKSEEKSFYEQLLHCFTQAQTQERGNDFLLDFLRSYWQNPQAISATELLQACCIRHQVDTHAVLCTQATYGTRPMVQLASGEQLETSSENSYFVPLCRMAHHVYLLGICETADYTRALNRLYDEWVECGSLKDIYLLVKGVGC